MAEETVAVRHTIRPHAAEHALVARMKRGRKPATGPERYVTRCGRWVEKRSVLCKGQFWDVTCAACRQRSQDHSGR